MGNFGVLLVALLGLHYAAGQEVREIFPLTSAQQRELRFVHNPALLEVAARANENVFLRFRAADMFVVVQENVNVFFDCLPWASNFPGGSIRWLIRSLELDSVLGLRPRSGTAVFAPAVNGSRIMIGGLPPLNRWLNITGTIATEGAQDPDFGDYQCEVCIDRERSLDDCHTSTTRLFIAGAPPDVLAGQDNMFETNPLAAGRVSNTIQVGGDFCVTQEESNDYVITCDVADIPAPVPENFSIQWLKDGQEVASFISTEPGRMINPLFYADGSGNEVFDPMTILPPVLNLQTNDIRIDTLAINRTMMATPAPDPMALTNEIRRMIVNSFVGNWTCRASNIYGSDSQSTIIRRCEGRPTFPGCPGGVTAIFPMAGSVVPIGCAICIPQGTSVILDCNAMTPSNTLFYRWTVNGTNITTTSRRLRVSEEASYTCRASNLDFPNEMETSVLIFSTALDFSARITNTAGGQVAGSGCNRLRDPVSADVCVFIGEQVNITCRNTETGALMNYTDINDNMFASGSRTVNDATFESNYTCSIGTADACGRVGRSLNIRVFDPARVDRLSTEPAGSLGVGQFIQVQRPVIGDPLTLSCQTNGIDDPSTSWFRVNEASGCGVEEPITNGVTTTPEGDSTLLISDFQPENSGTYVCRTDNIAGRDAASIVLSSEGESTAWTEDNEFSECSLMCRDGIRRRSVSCRSSPGGRLRPVSECSAITPPNAMETCERFFPNECLLTPIFGASRYGPCSRGCKGGHRERDVFCFVPMTREVVDLDRCRRTGLPEPKRFDLCRDTCCVRDDHPACGRMYNMGLFCQFKEVQQLCCWACQDFIAYENTGDNTVDIVLG